MNAGIKLKMSEFLVVLAALILMFAAAGFFIHKRQVSSNDFNWSSYKEIRKNLFVEPDTSQKDRKMIVAMVSQAKKRVEDLFGERASNPIIIITKNPEFGKRFGMKNNTGVTQNTLAGSYVVIGTKGLLVDIIAHELVHAELTYRIGGFSGISIPIWFQDGLADQVDLTPMFSEKAWVKWTRNGKKTVKMTELETTKQFYVNDYDERTYNYVVATHEVRVWMRSVGQKGLLKLISEVQSGENFYKAYEKIEAEYKNNAQH